VIGLLVAGCGSGNGQSGAVVELGAWAPQTGPNSVIFPIVQATDACLKNVNANGGINGHTFDFQIIDDQYDPALSVNAARKLVLQQDVLAVVGALGTATNLATQGYLKSQKVPSVGPGTGSPKVAGDYTFMTWPSYSTDGAFQAKYALESLGAKKLGITYQNDDLGGPFHDGAAYQTQKMGSGLVSAPFGLNEQDFIPAVSKLKAAGVDVAIVAGSPKNFPLIVKAAETISYRPKWMAANYDAEPSVLRKLPPAQTRNMSFSSWHALPGSPDVAEMRAAMKKYYPNVPPSVYTVEGWLTCTVFAEAFKRMTDGGAAPSREALVKTLNQLKNYSNGYVKNISYTPEKHTVAVNEFPFTWTGSDLKETGPFVPVPEVPTR
jgi:branched-chain amino acid transport system substrate-binding protein